MFVKQDMEIFDSLTTIIDLNPLKGQKFFRGYKNFRRREHFFRYQRADKHPVLRRYEKILFRITIAQRPLAYSDRAQVFVDGEIKQRKLTLSHPTNNLWTAIKRDDFVADLKVFNWYFSDGRQDVCATRKADDREIDRLKILKGNGPDLTRFVTIRDLECANWLTNKHAIRSRYEPESKPLKAVASFQTNSANRYLAMLCNHFGKPVESTCIAGKGWVQVPTGRCDMTAGAHSLKMLVSADDQTRLDQLAQIGTNHLERFAFAKPPSLSRSRPRTDAPLPSSHPRTGSFK